MTLSIDKTLSSTELTAAKTAAGINSDVLSISNHNNSVLFVVEAHAGLGALEFYVKRSGDAAANFKLMQSYPATLISAGGYWSKNSTTTSAAAYVDIPAGVGGVIRLTHKVAGSFGNNWQVVIDDSVSFEPIIRDMTVYGSGDFSRSTTRWLNDLNAILSTVFTVSIETASTSNGRLGVDDTTYDFANGADGVRNGTFIQFKDMNNLDIRMNMNSFEAATTAVKYMAIQSRTGR